MTLLRLSASREALGSAVLALTAASLPTSGEVSRSESEIVGLSGLSEAELAALPPTEMEERFYCQVLVKAQRHVQGRNDVYQDSWPDAELCELARVLNDRVVNPCILSSSCLALRLGKHGAWSNGWSRVVLLTMHRRTQLLPRQRAATALATAGPDPDAGMAQLGSGKQSLPLCAGVRHAMRARGQLGVAGPDVVVSLSRQRNLGMGGSGGGSARLAQQTPARVQIGGRDGHPRRALPRHHLHQWSRRPRKPALSHRHVRPAA
jgi:hypothetical protein